jgi:transposase
MVYHGNVIDQMRMRAYVIYLGAEKKYSFRKISEKAGVSKSTACRILSSSKKQSISKEKRGRPKKLSPRDRRHLLRSLFKLPEINPGFSIKSLVAYSGLHLSGISYRTFYRELRREGFQYLQARKKGLVSRTDRGKRIKFARKSKQILQNEPMFFQRSYCFLSRRCFFRAQAKANGANLSTKRQSMEEKGGRIKNNS